MTNPVEPDSAPSGPDSESRTSGLSPQSRWLPIGLGLGALILILVLALPGLRQQIATQPAQPDSSTAELEEPVAADPENEAEQYRAAGDSYRSGRFEEAWTQFRSADAYRRAVEADPSIAQSEQGVQASPASKEAHFRLGTAWARAQLLAPAEMAFQQAIALDPTYADAHANLGVTYYQMGRLSDALREYDAVLENNPDDADVHYNKGAVFVQQALEASPPDEALLTQAVGQFQRALEINPQLAQAHFSLGVVHFQRAETQEAIAEFQRFLELDDGSDPQATTLAQSYLEQLQQ